MCHVLSLYSVLGVYVSNLHKLEAIVQHSRFISLVRDKLDLTTYSREDSDPISCYIEPEVSKVITVILKMSNFSTFLSGRFKVLLVSVHLQHPLKSHFVALVVINPKLISCRTFFTLCGSLAVRCIVDLLINCKLACKLHCT